MYGTDLVRLQEVDATSLPLTLAIEIWIVLTFLTLKHQRNIRVTTASSFLMGSLVCILIIGVNGMMNR